MNADPHNALLYTFSTIPQTIAGAIAVLGAFVLYRLQIMHNDVDGLIQTILIARDEFTVHGRGTEALNNPVRSAFLEYCAAPNKFSLGHTFYRKWFPTEAPPIISNLIYKRELKTRCFRALIATITLVMISILTLMNSVQIIHGYCNAAIPIVYCVGFLGLLLCLYFYYSVIQYALASLEDVVTNDKRKPLIIRDWWVSFGNARWKIVSKDETKIFLAIGISCVIGLILVALSRLGC